MTRHQHIAGTALALFTLLTPVSAAQDDKSAAKVAEIAPSVVRMLESHHFDRKKFNDEVAPGVTQARRALEGYFELLDPNRLFFIQDDINEFLAEYGDNLQDDIMLGNLSPALRIYDRLLERVGSRVEWIKEEIQKDPTFESDRTAEINRDKENWPASTEAADEIWSARIEAELLQGVLAERAMAEATAKLKAEKKDTVEPTADKAVSVPPAEPQENVATAPRTPRETIERRYQRLLKSYRDETLEDRAQTFLSALTQSYDPHSQYLSQSDLDSFEIQMKLQLVGIGAVLRSEDGYAKIVELVSGGPADLAGELKANDRIVGVAQGNGEFEDVVDLKLNKIVEQIRGKKGTTVRLKIMPASAADPSNLEVVPGLQMLPSAAVDPSKFEVISIVRDKVQLKDQEAKAQIIDIPSESGGTDKIGWLTLPSFYADMTNRGPSARSTTTDMISLIERMKKEGIDGLVIDLRSDSGGSLPEAIRSTGLFLPQGPIVQVKDTNGKIAAMNDPDPGMMWDGPLIVLMNRMSASASEIFAAALQDYGRALIVGDEQSFGKGTVQEMIYLDQLPFIPFFTRGDNGAVKLTRQKFYRVKGGSTQLRGVASDIVLPSLTDHPDIGEGSAKNAMEYDEVPARAFTPAGNISSLIPRLRTESDQRVAESPEFAYIEYDRERIRKRLEENNVSLNKAKRITEIDEEKARREARVTERKARESSPMTAVDITLDTVDAPVLQQASLDKPPKSAYTRPKKAKDPAAPDEEEPFVDPIRDETLMIMRAYIQLQGQPPITAQAAASTEPTPAH